MAGSSSSRRRRGVRDGLVTLKLRSGMRGRLPIGGAVAFGGLAAAVTLLGLSAFRTVGLSQVTPAALARLTRSTRVPNW